MNHLLPSYPVSYTSNSKAIKNQVIGERQLNVLNNQAFQQAKNEITTWPGYQPTPLRDLHLVADAIGVAHVWYKDESERFNLGSFKALGGAYAVLNVIKQQLVKQGVASDVSAADLMSGLYAETTQKIVVTCATDGNHGRSVAWGAQIFGCGCVIYIHQTVSEGRKQAIAAYGAEVVRVEGNYDDSVRLAAEDAQKQGRFVVSDTSYPGYMNVPRDVMQGYTVMIDEALNQMPEPPTHVFIQGGVGGLAAAAVAHCWEVLGANRPRFIIVEPEDAACLFESAEAGRPVSVTGDLDTIMAGLACGEVSLLAWEILEEGADDFLCISDSAAADAMRLLANKEANEDIIVAGESAVAGLAGLILVSQQTSLKERLELSGSSRVLLLGSEGATDPDVYKQILSE